MQTMDDDVRRATEEWRGELGAAWAQRNPVDVRETDESWMVRFGVTKSRALQGMIEGVVPRGLSWLDVGCASGAHTEIMRAIGQRCDHGCDLNEPALSRFNGTAVCADARSLPYADRSFDGITTSGALMHVGGEGELVRAVQELDRVARTWLLCVELWQPKPMLVSFADIMPQAWVYPWERVMPHILGEQWTLVRSAVLRSCGRVQRVQALALLLLFREPDIAKKDGTALWGERPYPWWG